MSLDYNSKPNFTRDRELSLNNVTKDRLNAFISKPSVSNTADETFDGLAKVYLKGEALKEAIGNMNPIAFIPVEDGATVIASIQRQYGTVNKNIITFGMFKSACELISNYNVAIDEEYLLHYNIVDPKLENTSITTKHKKVSDNGNDWISCFLEQLSSFAGMLIAGKMADLSFAISPQIDVDTAGNTGSFKTWGAQGSLIAVCLLIELGLSQLEFKKLYGHSKYVPDDIKGSVDELINDPAKREEILSEAGFDYAAFRSNQKFNDNKAIKQYALDYISKNQNDLNFDHWISYVQINDTNSFVHHGLAMAPSVSPKWRKLFASQDNISQTTTDINTLVNEQDLGDVVGFAMTSTLSNYLNRLGGQANESYNKAYQSLSYQLDPALICCLVWYLGPLDTSSLKRLSNVVKIAALGSHGSLKDMVSYFGDNVLSSLLHMMCHYVNQILDNVLRQVYVGYKNIPNDQLDLMVNSCVGLKLVLNISGLSLGFASKYLHEMLEELHMFIHKITEKADTHSIGIAKRRSAHTLSAMLDHLITQLDSIQHLCVLPNNAGNNVNDQISDEVFNFVSINLPTAFPVLNMTEADRRKHFANIKPILLDDFGIEIAGTSSIGDSNVFNTTSVPECGHDSGAIKNIELGKQFAQFMRGN